MIGPEHEGLRPRGPGETDAVTVAFADPAAELYGSARIGLSGDDATSASAFGILFSGSEPAGATAAGDIDAASPAWEKIEAGGVSLSTVEPLRSWRAAMTADGASFEIELQALCEPLEFGEGSAVAGMAGMRGYEQPCRVQGSVEAGGRSARIDCLGQRGHSWGATDWEAVEAVRVVCAWADDGHALTLAAARPAGGSGHESEAIDAFVVDPGEDGPAGHRVAEPRLSTTYDADGRHRRASLELWETEEDEYPHRAAGQAVCGTSLELGRLRLDAAFFSWHLDGQPAIGRYDILRRL